MRVSTLFMIAAVVAVAAASSLAAASPMVTHHADLERAERLGWTRAFRSAPDQVVNMRFAVRQKNMDRVHALVAEISDPKNAKYGQHLSFAEVGELTRDQLASALLSSFLRTNGAKDVRVSKNHDWVWATCTVAVAEQMFSTEFHAFARDNQLVHRALHITLPAHIADTFEYVSGVHNFHQRYSRHAVFGASRLRSNTATKVGAGQFGDVYPQVLEKYYGFPSATITSPRGSLSVFEALGQSYAPADLTTFETSYGVGQGENVVDVIGPNTPSACTADPNNCGEASLDVQVVVGCAPGVPLTFWSIDQSVQDIFGEWIAAVANDDSAPLVHSISYGGDESGEDTGSLQRFNDEVMKLALRGITVIASSGDDGAPGSDGRGGQCPATTMPAFPASAPAVTAVGASMGIENDQPEAACLSQSGGLISTGAGFSNVFATPSWQSSQVSQYLNSGVVLPSSTAFNASGHAYPHVVMAGHNYETIIAGQVSIGSGTSASAPAFASAVALANEARLAAGKSALGYLNPFLYGTVYGSDATNAVQTAGVQNNCCAGQTGTQNCCAGLGFSGTTSGWNPLAGIGSINVPKFIKLALSV